MNVKKELKEDIIHFLNSIDEDNFSSSYQGLIDIVLSYKPKKISIEDIKSLLKDVYSEIEFDDSQEEVLVELSNRLEGYCSDEDRIFW